MKCGYTWFFTLHLVFLGFYAHGSLDEIAIVLAADHLSDTSNSTSLNSNSNVPTPLSSRTSSSTTTEEIYNNYLTDKTPSLHSLLDQSSSAPDSPNSISHSKRILFLQAIQLGYKDVVLDLLSQGQDPNTPDSRGFSPLHLAAIQGDCHIIQALIEAGADVDAVDASGRNPLFLAAHRHTISVVELLLQHNSPTINADGIHCLQTVEGSTAQTVSLAEVFLAFNLQTLPAQVAALTYVQEAKNRQTALETTLMLKNLALGRPLIQKGYYCSPGVKSLLAHIYNTFLTAIKQDNIEDIDRFYQQGISLIIPDGQGNTPLHRAVILRRPRVIAYLLEAGAPVTVRNNAGKTPIDLIKNSNGKIDTTLLKLFLDYAYKSMQKLETPADAVFALLQDSDSDSDSVKKCCGPGQRDSSDSDSDTTPNGDRCTIE